MPRVYSSHLKVAECPMVPYSFTYVHKPTGITILGPCLWAWVEEWSELGIGVIANGEVKEKQIKVDTGCEGKPCSGSQRGTVIAAMEGLGVESSCCGLREQGGAENVMEI